MVFTLMTMFIMPYMYTCINFQIKYITCRMILLKKCFKVLIENFNLMVYFMVTIIQTPWNWEFY